MLVQETRVKDGYEDIYDKAVELKANLEEEIRKQVEEKSISYDNIIKECIEVVEVEVEEPETADETPVEA